MQPEERKDSYNDDNQSDQINNIVHTRASLALQPAWARENETGGTRDCSINVVDLYRVCDRL
jgi:hypothetical protein